MKNRDADDIRPEYPPELIRAGERGKYAEGYREGTNIVRTPTPNSSSRLPLAEDHTKID